MSYRIDFAPEADADFARLPPLVASSLLEGFDGLSRDPYEHLVPHHFPFVPTDWLFKWRCEVDGDHWIVTVGVTVDVPAKVVTILWLLLQPRIFE